MKKIHIIIVLAIILLLLIGNYTGIIPLSVLGGGEYHTGFSMDDVNNCETVHYKWGCHDLGTTWGCWYGNVMVDYEELFFSPSNNRPIVTSMKRGSGEESIEVVCHATLTYLGIPFVYWTPDWGAYMVDIKYDPLGSWHTIINTRDGTVDEDIVAFVTGSTKKQNYYTMDSDQIIPGLPNPYEFKNLNPIGFAIKGPQVGIIRVCQLTEFIALGGLLREQHVTSEDYAFLISGNGNVDLVDPQTRYIAGEDKVRFRVDTGYSGYTQGGEYSTRGWELKIYDNYGNIRKTWTIDDDKQGTRYDRNNNILDYSIPSDAVQPGESHTWRVVLTNTLFDQDHEEFFTITKEELAMAPDIKPIEFSENQYRLGDNVVIYLEGIPNPLGRNIVDGFLVNIIYGRDGIDYVEDYHLKYVKATSNKATITFNAAKGDTYVTIEAWAFDAPEASGGIMSEQAKSQVWIRDKEYPPIPEFDWWSIIISAVLAIVFILMAYVTPVPKVAKILIVIVGIAIAILYYLYSTGFF